MQRSQSNSDITVFSEMDNWRMGHQSHQNPGFNVCFCVVEMLKTQWLSGRSSCIQLIDPGLFVEQS